MPLRAACPPTAGAKGPDIRAITLALSPRRPDRGGVRHMGGQGARRKPLRWRLRREERGAPRHGLLPPQVSRRRRTVRTRRLKAEGRAPLKGKCGGNAQSKNQSIYTEHPFAVVKAEFAVWVCQCNLNVRVECAVRGARSLTSPCGVWLISCMRFSESSSVINCSSQQTRPRTVPARRELLVLLDVNTWVELHESAGPVAYITV